ncbi:hypothetical protein [Geitlerinema calcuttense]|uniref:Uncharacterized protein n=1 Tax=Geitlerinema calcuttense NRMC-F 0142 TaxID=2922238 RepID=A0ABT7M087_9CYAN|nr:hypothetical protein [Geitlerinema calcuttense]MCD8488369.1 hypothetical protein [Desertifilum sp.]MDL5057242.1 hypothetical protein [Geitlerinema calcuttense NRMC-F 0142]
MSNADDSQELGFSLLEAFDCPSGVVVLLSGVFWAIRLAGNSARENRSPSISHRF